MHRSPLADFMALKGVSLRLLSRWSRLRVPRTWGSAAVHTGQCPGGLGKEEVGLRELFLHDFYHVCLQRKEGGQRVDWPHVRISGLTVVLPLSSCLPAPGGLCSLNLRAAQEEHALGQRRMGALSLQDRRMVTFVSPVCSPHPQGARWG